MALVACAEIEVEVGVGVGYCSVQRRVGIAYVLGQRLMIFSSADGPQEWLTMHFGLRGAIIAVALARS